MYRIMVINSKGGCGKTTIATNLAAYYADQGLRTVIFDYDAQSSSVQWVRSRDASLPEIHCVAACRNSREGVTRTWQLRVPEGTDRVIFDTPAGIAGQELADLVRRVDSIIVPVQPSPIDIHACSHFIRDLLLVGRVRRLDVRVGVVANRARERTHGFSVLGRFLANLNIPFIATLRDTQNYVKAAEQGVGIHELDAPFIGRDLEQWAVLLRWLEGRDDQGVAPAQQGAAQVLAAASHTTQMHEGVGQRNAALG